MLPWPTNPSDEPVADLLRAHRQIHPHGDVALVRQAYATAERMHWGQKRISGEDYITHPLAVAEILADLGMDTTTLVAALLHDTVEDTSYTLPRLHDDFGPEVALLVDGVTKFDKGFFGADAEGETIRKLLLRAGQDVRVLVIKLADRLHNMRTLDVRSTASRVRIATVTRDMLVPLCDRLGIQALKRELEDTVLLALHPDGYEEVRRHVATRPDWASFLNEVIGTLQPELARAKIDARVAPRPRHFYSVWKDAQDKHQPTPRELPRIVIIVEGRQTDCYAALGTVHSTWRPVPGRFKDFIASPKNNLYRSLHTTVLGPDDQPLEVLIRTEPMHRAAEYGIVANFRFPEFTARLSKQARAEQLAWLHRVLDWEAVADDAQRFLDALRCDLSEGQIHVFTDDGRRVQLPSGSTAVDLAYTLDVHTGHRCVAAHRGGRLIPLSSPLADGDVVEIVYTDQATYGPSPDWLEFVRTPHARLQITQWFDDGEPATIGHKVRIGRAAIGLALRQRNRGLANDDPLMSLADELGYPDMEALLVAVAEHRLAPEELVERMIKAVDTTPP
ncbi:MAG: bifunctional (p)ppGpp synthetase/guanosine-3',5'-bis(diphosphate) 3'-pyrophosphohydrolase [Actinobacteria bacterium]|nr:MAG: bifunctional (p)ppGpp synthetase/guanosine-3',5'-bis(diphosphate) 3'-pyrophosphohydrolase [Actinomycetota bacterium]